MKKKSLSSWVCMVAIATCLVGCKNRQQDNNNTEKPYSVVSDKLPLADPYVMCYEGTYYIYGTYNTTGFDVYSSKDLEKWEKAPQRALVNTDSYGENRFWAPEVYYVEKEKKFYMFYSTEEHVCVATSDSQFGPFKQEEMKPIREEKGIDTSVFFDEDGKAYLYFVRFTDGNVIWVAELEDGLKSIKEETLTQCVRAEEAWETVAPRVAEGPSVFKKDGTYYLMYSANDYRSQDYAVGFATSKSPMGPWKKFEGNPVLHKYGGLMGVGHGAPFVGKDGKMRYVFHAHNSVEEVHPRTSYFVDMEVENGVIKLDGDFIQPVVVEKLLE